MLWLVCLALAGGTSGFAQGEQLAVLKDREKKMRSVVERVTSSVVAITSDRPIGTGSGVIIGQDGLILTAAHVTDAITEHALNKEVVVILADGRRVKGEVLGANRSFDSAMVRIIGEEKQEWPAAEIGRSDTTRKGDWVLALGQPGGFDQGRTPPVRAGRVWGRDNFGAFFTDCTLIGGDSGGPLFDLEGKLVGIHSSIGGPLTINRHIGVDNFRSDWDRLLKGESWGELVLGEIDPDRPVIGALLDERSENGVRIIEVMVGGPANKAGLFRDDLITSFEGETIDNYLHFIRLISRKEAGDAVKLLLQREGHQHEADLTLASRRAARHFGPAWEKPAAPKAWLGAEVETGESRDVVVSEIAAKSPAEKAGLKKDDVITHLDEEPIADAVQLARALSRHEPLARVKVTIRRQGKESQLHATLTAFQP